jgi:putative transposase
VPSGWWGCRSTSRYRNRAANQNGLRQRLKELAATHLRYGYRRLTVLLRREGWPVNAKRIYRLYRQEGLIVRTKQRKKMARRERSPQPLASRPNQYWSMAFVSDKLADGTSFRISPSSIVHVRVRVAGSRSFNNRSQGCRCTEEGKCRAQWDADEYYLR